MPRLASKSRLRALALGAAFCACISSSLAPSAVQAQIGLYPDEVDRLDVITIEQDGRDLHAFSSVTGSRGRLRLDLEEVVLFNESRGRIGIVLTSHRAIGVSTNGGFSETRYRIAERAPERALVSQRIGLVATGRRALGFVGPSGIWIEEALTPEESIEAVRAGAAVGIVITNRRALGLAPEVGRFASMPFQLREKLESVDAEDTLAKLRTDRRLLIFTGPGAVWTFRNRNLE
ncbi:MAG: hypothetical protein IPK00_27610 [Deltaproteobacteria bacterium]|nr:hypothetical protein [Deltaproteobacteria bacterium]